MFEAARAYAALGWRVFPVAPGTKRPYARSHGVNDSTSDPIEIAVLWSAHPEASIGIDCGRSEIVAVDVDGAAGEETMAALAVEHGSLPDTVEALTPGGGRHLLFRHPGGYVASRGGVWPAVDVRANGGYIVVAPSKHPSGREYRWAPERSPFECEIARMPEWLRAGCREQPRADCSERPRAAAAPDDVTPELLGMLIAGRVRAYLAAAR